MFGECHAHIFMDGVNYQEALKRQQNGEREDWIRQVFSWYQEKEITYVREGGDNLGVSLRAKEIAPEYGIEYRSPVFAIHKNGHYGGIVGYGFDTMREYAALVERAAGEGADFIKIMTTGLLDFRHNGHVTGTALPFAQVREMVHIAHEEGFAVMSHTNGDQAVQEAIESGVDSIEHGNFITEKTVRMLADSPSIWVPTAVTVHNMIGDGRYEDSVLKRIWAITEENLQAAWECGAKVALGSDAGAYCVLHGQGLVDEYHLFQAALGAGEKLDRWLTDNEKELRKRFRRG